jgi:ABC-type dipeptide/oligopeptide/nickel transport system permease component
MEFGGLLAGAVVVEQIFFYPGLGTTFYRALLNDDRQLLQVMLLATSLMFLTFHILATTLMGNNED